MAVPIWKDKVVSLHYASVLFRIYNWDTSEVLYTGKANARPGESVAKVRMNDVCADYLRNELPTITDRTFTQLGNVIRFGVQEKPAGTWTPVADATFYNDWSYDYNFTASVLSAPINGRLDRKMYLLTTKLQTTSITASYKKSGGSTTTRTATVSGTKDGTAAFNVAAVSDTVTITVNGYTYKVVTECAKYALYYVNAYGGWDQFLIEGNTIESDSIDRHTVETEYDNTALVNRGMDNYVNGITKTWTFNSGLLTDDESSRMHHLLNSTFVYLRDLATGDMIPVVMDTDSWEVKTYRNQGNRKFNYTFSVKLAQNRIRR